MSQDRYALTCLDPKIMTSAFIREKEIIIFLIVLFHVQLDFLSQPESHTLARPQQRSKAKVVSLSEVKERMMSSLAVKD